MARAKTMPMFPLGRVLFPHEALPLHVFEPRYRDLVEACLAGDGEFGVVLIERGSEVGGGDSRFSVGTVAKIVEAGKLPDGRYLLATVGTRRLRVRRWLPDDPYPRAEVDVLANEAPPVTRGVDLAELERELRRVCALARRAGPARSRRRRALRRRGAGVVRGVRGRAVRVRSTRSGCSSSTTCRRG